MSMTRSGMVQVGVAAVVSVTMFATAVMPVAAASSTHNLLANANWRSYRSDAKVTRSGGMFTIAEERGGTGRFWADVDVKADEQYVVLIAHTRAEDVRSSGDITGLPYVYGYAMDRKGNIEEYLQGQHMTHGSSYDMKWTESYGIFKVNDDVEGVRFFLQQANQQGTVEDGREANFRNPGLYVVKSRKEAEDIVDWYTTFRPSGESTNVHTSTTSAKKTSTVKVTPSTSNKVSASKKTVAAKNYVAKKRASSAAARWKQFGGFAAGKPSFK